MAYFKQCLLLSSLAYALSVSSSLNAATCVGNCGTLGPDGDIPAPPISDTYDWVSTNLGEAGVGQLEGFPGTTGSTFTTAPFFASAGSEIEFYFNYVTSDGSTFADYAWAQLQQSGNAENIFTARTKPSGNIVPGQDLPPVSATLTPETVEITPDATNWSPLGTSSGSCFGDGCGNTGWVKSNYTIQEEGTFNLAFGVSNFQDTIFDSGLAFAGVTLDGNVVGDGSTADSPLLPQDVIDDTGAFVFEITPTENEIIFIDPEIAVGYLYQIASGDNSFADLILPDIGDGQYAVSGEDGLGNSFIDIVTQGDTFNFAAGVTEFTVSGIEISAALDPTDTNAFVTGISFANSNPVTVTQTPIIIDVPAVAAIPEPSTYAMLIAGLGLLGFATSRRKV